MARHPVAWKSGTLSSDEPRGAGPGHEPGRGSPLVEHAVDRGPQAVGDAGDAFTWASGKDTSTYDMAPAPAAAGEAAALLTRQQDGKTYRQRLRLSAQALHIEKVEVEADGRESFRNRYEFVRGER